MNSPVLKTDYLLLLRSTNWHEGLSPEEIQRVMGQWMEWYNRFDQQGKIKGANPLEGEGKVISGKSRTVADGPFAEAKESIAGYFLLSVDSMEEAVQYGQECPALPYGMTVEVRPVASACMPSKIVSGEVLVADM
jgi:hypothetical protein